MAYKKCAICGKTIIDEQGVPYKERFVHENCFNIAIKTLHKDKVEKLEKKSDNTKTKTNKKAKVELKESLTEEEYRDKKMYYDYLRGLMIDSQLSAKAYVLSEDCIKKYDLCFKGMYLTLLYLHEIIEKELTGDIVGIIPYYYEEAKQYYLSVEKIEQENKDVMPTKMYKEKIIKITPKQKKIKQIDITQIGRK